MSASPAVTRITLVRHGQTDWNRDGRYQGSSDIPLNEAGREQAQSVGQRLRGRSFDAVFASPLARAWETAEIIATVLSLAGPQALPGIRERSYGQAEGMTSAHIEERFGVDRHNIPGWEDDDQLVARALPSLVGLADRVPNGRVLAVTHGGVIAAVLRAITGGTRPASGERIGNGSIHDLEATGGTLRLVAMNVPPERLDSLNA